MSRQLEPNAAVEINDSTLERIEPRGSDAVAVLHAYVHRSAGRPGIDRGTGWVQPLQLHFPNANVTGTMGAMPMELLSGRLLLSGQVFENVLPIPLSHVGPSKIELESWNEAKIIIEGDGITAEFAGEAEYVEEFEP